MNGGIRHARRLATVGVAAAQKGVPAQLEALMADVAHSAFISGMTASFLVASAVAVAGALIALLVRRGQDRTHGH
jgi:hypothetical protein